MKQIFYLLMIFVLTVSCRRDVKPIEKFYNKNYIVTSILKWSDNCTELQLKNADTILSVFIIPFDAQNLKIGDTLK